MQNDDLLDIKQAAAFLQVSETSLRRWTNTGLLAALRVGGRRERRFRKADLIAFLESKPALSGEPNSEAAAAPGTGSATGSAIGGSPVAYGAHLCALYAGDADRAKIAAAFLADGIRGGSAAFLAAARPVQTAIVAVLAAIHPAVEKDLAAGRLVLSEHADTPRAQYDYWEASFARALSAGATSLRVVGDVSGGRLMLGKTFAQMLEYESGYDQFIARRFPVVTLCLHDARLYNGLDVRTLFKAHADTFRYPVERLMA